MAKNGLVHITTATFTTQASVSIEGCFSATYTHYLLRYDMLSSAGNVRVNGRLRVGGSDNSSAQYRRQYLYGSSTTVGGGRETGNTSWLDLLGRPWSTTEKSGYCEVWISNPFEAVRTTAWSDFGILFSGNLDLFGIVHANDAETSYTSLTVFPESGTITGSISVYGLVKS